ncbi:MerR family transcriptional regulator [uncultured Brevundimonas sp.]|uniref:MerR family transcriptional regulator n=1 Tax=uncultured Brevundimonas sp. TaxID=213418 RepID=UPI0030EBF864|tara:strand:- start:272 stop:700 length:429 start_codon:yes stop_codon:yes gene_type:complete
MAKGPNAFRTISEAADDIGTPQHVLRFWETKFSFISPLKRAGGRRFYRPQDIVLLKAVRRLLHDEGLTIKGVQRLHREQGVQKLAAYGNPEAGVSYSPAAMGAGDDETSPTPSPTAANPVRLQTVLAEIEGARLRLEAVLAP